MSKHCRSIAWSITFAIACAMPVQASAQQIEEVVVTATHREESIQDVPIAVTAMGAEQLEAAGIFDATTIALNVPGMAYAEFSPGQALIALRGVTSADDGAGLDNSVALFLDGIYIGRQAGINFDMFDLERIEVLKGPQGTLFGRNAVAGAINIITSKPEDEFAGKFAATVGNEGIVRYQGLVTGPLSESLSGKLVVNHREHDGFVRNTLLNKDLQDEDYTSVRGQLRLSTAASEWLLSADVWDDDRVDMGRAPISDGSAPLTGIATSLGAGRPGTSASPIDGFSKREGSGVSVQGDIEFDSGVLTSITGFRNTESSFDMASLGAPLGADVPNGVFGIDVNDDIDEEIDTFSQELRWTSTTGGAIQYIGGLFYFLEDTDRSEQFRLDRNTVATGQVTVGNEFTRTENETTSIAAYGSLNWDINDLWRLTAGARWTRDERDYVASAVNCALDEATRAAAGFPNFGPCQGVGGSLGIVAEVFRVPTSGSWTDFSPMISLQYSPTADVMLYGTVSTGYKAGGFPGGQGLLATATIEIEPEDVTNFELGFKGDFADNTLRLNASAFFMDYTDLQVVRFGPVTGVPFGVFLTSNIESADITGLEVDFKWYATENFSISGYYAYLDTEINGLVFLTTPPTDFSGLPLRQAPENSYNVVLNYELSAANGSWNFRTQFSHADDQHNDYPTNAVTIIEDADLLDASIGWTSPSDRYKVTVWGKNLTDERYITHSYRVGPGSIGVWSDPLTVGVTGQINF